MGGVGQNRTGQDRAGWDVTLQGGLTMNPFRQFGGWKNRTGEWSLRAATDPPFAEYHHFQVKVQVLTFFLHLEHVSVVFRFCAAAEGASRDGSRRRRLGHARPLPRHARPLQGQRVHAQGRKGQRGQPAGVTSGSREQQQQPIRRQVPLHAVQVSLRGNQVRVWEGTS